MEEAAWPKDYRSAVPGIGEDLVIPRDFHFVFGLEEQHEPFHFIHYLSIESCRRTNDPRTIYFHFKHLPWGPWWERIASHLQMVEVELVEEVLAADYSRGYVPPSYRYAHHADFIRLDALIEHGGVYADLDTIFVRPFPAELFEAPFVIGSEIPVPDELTGELRPSQCNAVLMSEQNAPFARAWRVRMGGALNGTWSNHSGFLSQALSEEMPEAVRVEPEATFFPFPADLKGISQLFTEQHPIPAETLSVHLWAHLWWRRDRRDFTDFHAGWATPSVIRRARTTFAELARPYVPDLTQRATRRAASRSTPPTDRWLYLSQDEPSGYGIAADRCRAALEESGAEVDWVPFLPGHGWGLSYQPPLVLDPFISTAGPPEGTEPDQVVVAHLVPEYLPLVRQRCPDAFLVGHTVWETDRIPDHWTECLDSADLLVVPSRFSAEAIASSPVSSPVAVVPHVAPRRGAPATEAWGSIAPDQFVFYTIAEWNERKAVFKTVEAYLRAFRRSDPVLLIVKSSVRDFTTAPSTGLNGVGPGTTAWSLAQLLAKHRDPPAVLLVTRELSDADMYALHRRGDCFVSLCRSEGWGLGSFDAAAYGNPVVTTGFGGQLEYLAGSPYLVDFDLVPVDHPSGFPSYAPDQHWADPNVDHGAELLVNILSRHHEATEMAGAAASAIRWQYRPYAIAAAFRSVVQDHRNHHTVPVTRSVHRHS
jgi:glycosyltransferase involved in cell wall biosynthesis